MLFADFQALRAFLDGPPVCALDGTEFAKESPRQAPLYRRVADWYRKNKYATVDAPHIGRVTLDKRAVTRSIHHGLTYTKGVAFAAVPAVLYFGRILRKEPLRGSKAEGCVYYIAAPVTIAAVGFIVVVMVKSASGISRMYLHSVIAKEKLRQSAYPSGVIRPEGRDGNPHSAEAGAVWTVLAPLYAVNHEADLHS